MGTYELILTHVVELHYETRVHDEVWPKSWDDCLTDYAAWEAAGEPDGYVWGTNWSLAYPGFDTPDDDPVATQWSQRLGKQMFFLALVTDRFRLSLVFHDVRTRKLSEDDATIRQVLIPLPAYGFKADRLSGSTSDSGQGVRSRASRNHRAMA